MLTINEIKNLVTPICQNYKIDKLFLFGSYARNEATEKSDIDFRVDRGELTGFKFGGFYGDIQNALGVSIDILTTEQLKENFLDNINKEEIVIYERSGT